MTYRVNQMLCKVDWTNGVPFLKFRKVTRITKTTYYVADEKTPSYGWFEAAKKAIDDEYLSLFREWDILFGKREANWTIKDSVRCVCRLRRLERKLVRRRIRVR